MDSTLLFDKEALSSPTQQNGGTVPTGPDLLVGAAAANSQFAPFLEQLTPLLSKLSKKKELNEQEMKANVKGKINKKYEKKGEEILQNIMDEFDNIFGDPAKKSEDIIANITDIDTTDYLKQIVGSLTKEYEDFENKRTVTILKKMIEIDNSSLISFIDNGMTSTITNHRLLEEGQVYYMKYDRYKTNKNWLYPSYHTSKNKYTLLSKLRSSLFGKRDYDDAETNEKFMVFLGYENKIFNRTFMKDITFTRMFSKDVPTNIKYARFADVCNRKYVVKFRGIDDDQFKILHRFNKGQVQVYQSKPLTDTFYKHDIVEIIIKINGEVKTFYGMVTSVISRKITVYFYDKDKDNVLTEYEGITTAGEYKDGKTYQITLDITDPSKDEEITANTNLTKKDENNGPILTATATLIWGFYHNIYKNIKTDENLTFVDIMKLSDRNAIMNMFKTHFSNATTWLSTLITSTVKPNNKEIAVPDSISLLFDAATLESDGDNQDRAREIVVGLGWPLAAKDENSLYNTLFKKVYFQGSCYLFFKRSDGSPCYLQADHFFVNGSDPAIENKYFTFTPSRPTLDRGISPDVSKVVIGADKGPVPSVPVPVVDSVPVPASKEEEEVRQVSGGTRRRKTSKKGSRPQYRSENVVRRSFTKKRRYGRVHER